MIEYKYNLGGWESVELDQNCRDVPNRRLDAGNADTQQVEGAVHRFRGVDPCE